MGKLLVELQLRGQGRRGEIKGDMIMKKIIATMILLLLTNVVLAQHEHEPPKEEEKKPQTHPAEHQMKPMKHMEHENPASEFLMSEGAGTATNPQSGAMSMSMHKTGNWNFMTHGYAFLNFIQQSGPRGDDDVF